MEPNYLSPAPDGRPLTLEDLRSLRWEEAAQQAYKRPPFKRPGVAKDFVPVLATGGLGDAIISIGVAAEISRKTGLPARIWSHHPDAVRFIVHSLERAGTVQKGSVVGETGFEFYGYDYSIRLNCLGIVDIEPHFKGFSNAGLDEIYVANRRFSATAPWSDLIRFHPSLDNEVARQAEAIGLARASLPFAMLGLEHRPYKLKITPSFYDWEPYMTVHDGYEVNQPNLHRVTKTWSIRHWEKLVRMVKERHPEIYVVQLGGTQSRKIPGVDVDLVGRMKIEQSLQVLARSVVHVDGDSGLVHAANVLGVPSVAMFGPTPASFFGYRGNANLSPRECGGCWWLKQRWLDHCMLGHRSPKCMDSILPEDAFAAVESVLER